MDRDVHELLIDHASSADEASSRFGVRPGTTQTAKRYRRYTDHIYANGSFQLEVQASRATTRTLFSPVLLCTTGATDRLLLRTGLVERIGHAVDRWAEHVQNAWHRLPRRRAVWALSQSLLFCLLYAPSSHNTFEQVLATTESKHSLLCIGTEQHDQAGYDQVSYIFYILSVVTDHANASTSCFLLHASHTPNAMLL